MHPTPLLPLLALLPRTPSTCFAGTPGVCLGYNAPILNATAAILNACAKVPACTPGVTSHGRTTVTGKVLGFPYTATLFVGSECGGVEQWSLEACEGLFFSLVDERCEEVYPAGEEKFQLGYIRAPCDSTFVSFNFGG